MAPSQPTHVILDRGPVSVAFGQDQTSRASGLNGVRQNPGITYLPDSVRQRPNLAVRGDAHVDTGFLGFDVAMDMGLVMTFVSPANPTAQVTLFRADPSAGVQPQLSIEVDDADCQISRSVSTMAVLVYSPDSSGKR